MGLWDTILTIMIEGGGSYLWVVVCLEGPGYKEVHGKT